jgi:hypothetical protein
MSKEVSREAAERCADESPTLASMLRKGLPLTRDVYLGLAYGPDLPSADEWNAEHEMEVPECFRDPNAVKHDPGRKQTDAET